MGKHVVVAPDKFKGSLRSPQVGDAIGSVLEDELGSEWTVITSAMADGGEGTVDAVVTATEGERLTSTVTGPRGSAVEAEWGFIPSDGEDGATAVIEMAAASGIELLSESARDPERTTTYGTGELIEAALDRGVDSVILGIGGSATVDGGMGMARALGFRFLDGAGREVTGGGGELGDVETIEDDSARDDLRECRIRVACDVDNPLLGDRGAARVYGPQKGASPEQVERLESDLAHWADVVESWSGNPARDEPGAGAAGGLGFGLISLLGATLEPGAQLVMQVTGLNSKLEGADVVVTGEGRIDEQTAHGKTPHAVATAAAERDVDLVVGLAGALGPGYRDCYDPFDWFMALPVAPIEQSECLERAGELLRERTRDLARLIQRVRPG